MSLNCNGTWGQWSSCSNTCGGGTQQRHFQISQFPSSTGLQCPNSPETRQCQDYNGCDVNCQGYYSEWSPCSNSCGKGFKTRKFNITTPPKNNGTPCPLDQTVECEELTTCKSDCVYNKISGNCSTTCGIGRQPYTINVVSEGKYGGLACPAFLTGVDDCSSNTTCSRDCAGVDLARNTFCAPTVVENCNRSIYDASQCSASIENLDIRNPDFQSICRNNINPLQPCYDKIDFTANDGGDDDRDFTYYMCKKHLEQYYTLPFNCQFALRQNQKDTMFQNLCNNSQRIKNNSECREYCKNEPIMCLEGIKELCIKNKGIVNNPFCQDIISNNELFGRFDADMYNLCNNDPVIKELEICNCLNQDKINAFKQKFYPNQQQLIRSECLFPDCIGVTKKTYLMGKQTSMDCPSVCVQANQINLTEESKIGNLNINQACFKDCTGVWSDWTPCSKPCEEQSRKFTVKSQSEYGGKICEFEDGYIEKRPCPGDCSSGTGSGSGTGTGSGSGTGTGSGSGMGTGGGTGTGTGSGTGTGTGSGTGTGTGSGTGSITFNNKYIIIGVIAVVLILVLFLIFRK
jgi:hypothetical protein